MKKKGRHHYRAHKDRDLEQEETPDEGELDYREDGVQVRHRRIAGGTHD